MKLTQTDITALLKGLAIAVLGAALTYISQWIAGYDFGSYTPVVVAFWGTVVNIIRKYIDAPVSKATDGKVKL